MRQATGFLIVLGALWVTPALALEKMSARVMDREEDWKDSAFTTIGYYNNCTGWVWIWSGWTDGETIGVNFDTSPCPVTTLTTSWALTFSGVPSGYGFTGTIQVVRDNCGTVLASQPYLPPATSGWNATVWGVVNVPEMFTVNVIWAAPSGFRNDTGIASDHPFAGPTGPTACGTCFPTTRVSRTRYYGVSGAYCPSGTTLSDGLCDVELMMDIAVKWLCEPVGLDPRSWGNIKGLYR